MQNMLTGEVRGTVEWRQSLLLGGIVELELRFGAQPPNLSLFLRLSLVEEAQHTFVECRFGKMLVARTDTESVMENMLIEEVLSTPELVVWRQSQGKSCWLPAEWRRLLLLGGIVELELCFGARLPNLSLFLKLPLVEEMQNTFVGCRFGKLLAV